MQYLDNSITKIIYTAKAEGLLEKLGDEGRCAF